jgi:hypothetical protein
MLNIRKVSPMARAIGTIGVVAGLATAVTFAALQSQATLTDNTISTGTASLVVSNDATCNVDTVYGPTADGFDFSVLSGVGSSQNEHFCLKNAGDANLSTLLTTPALPTYEDSNTNPVTVDNNKVHLVLSCTTTTSGGISVNDPLFSVYFSGSNIGTLNAGDVADCNVHVVLDSDAYTADHIDSTGFDLLFTGSGV